MANFRHNHNKQHRGVGSGMTTKVGVFIGLVYLLYQGCQFLTGGAQLPMPHSDTASNSSNAETYSDLDLLFPTGKNDQVVKHQYFAFNYNEKYEVVDWVVHEVTKADIQKPNVQRTDDFRPDRKVKTGSAELYDYKRSGYDRGHLVPAGDMNFNKQAMSETFYMSNMTPQVHSFNTGIWRELEENIRDWAYRFKHVYVATGPVLSKEPIDYIGDNDVAVPHSFYKVIVDLSEPELKGIGFIIPNKVSFQPLSAYAVSIDEVEKVTNLDFFPDLIEDEIEEEIEANYNMKAWKVDQKRFEIRKSKWNKR